MNQFVLGALMMGYAVVALLFARAWRATGDRLFAFFALAFAILSGNQVAFLWFAERGEVATPLYLIRLSAYLLILGAIVDKNLRRR